MNKKQTLASLLLTVTILGTVPISTLAENNFEMTSPVEVVIPSSEQHTVEPIIQNQTEPEKIEKVTETVIPDTPVNPSVSVSSQPDTSSSSTSTDNSSQSSATVPSLSDSSNQGIVTEPKASDPNGKASETDKPSEMIGEPSEKPQEALKSEETPKPQAEEKQSSEVKQEPIDTEPPQAITKTEADILAQPVLSETGYTIVGTSEGQVYVQDETGQVELKAASEIGATKQADGTVAVTDDQGKLQVLPSTGEEQSLLSIVGLMGLVGIAIFYFKKKQQGEF